jgi:hypothetical protein
MLSPAEIANVLDTAAADAESFVSIASRLEKSVGEPSPDHPLAPFVVAFYYDLIEARSRRREAYAPYAPMTASLDVNLRNRLPHGLAGGDPLNAALLLHIACFLALLRPPE